MKVGLVSCAAKKLDHPAPARKLYSSTLFKMASTYAEQNYDEWYILSAKHGLVHPDTIIEPYDVTLKSMSKNTRQLWARSVMPNLMMLFPRSDGLTFYLHAGQEYREFLELWIPQVGYGCEVPLRGLGIGEQQHWYQHVARNK